MSEATESAYARFPGYRVDLEIYAGVIRARCHGVVIAESARALRVLETKHQPQIYFPRADVRMAYLERTDHTTHCPFKGHASYWHVRVDGGGRDNGAWSYEDPMNEVAGLKDYVAFYGTLERTLGGTPGGAHDGTARGETVELCVAG